MHSSSSTKALAWFLLSIVTSLFSDVFAKHLTEGYHFLQVTHFRFLFSTITLFPFLYFSGCRPFSTKQVGINCLRGVMLLVATGLWFLSLRTIPLASITAVGSTIPFFTFFFASIFLKETIVWQKIAAAVGASAGVVIIAHPGAQAFEMGYLILLLSTALYALLDVINRKIILKDSIFNMLFFSDVVGTLVLTIPSLLYWVTPSASDLVIFLGLGCVENLCLYFLLKAYSLEEASFLAPFHSVEIVLSIACGFLFFQEIPSSRSFLGICCITASTYGLFLYKRKAASKKLVPKKA